MGDYEDPRLFDKAAPWIGMYIAMASLVCVLCMVADLINGFLQRKWWIPSKFFSFNAATLTLLGVATRLASAADKSDVTIIKAMSLVFLSIAMTHAMPSLYGMDGVAMFSNVIALGILVISTFVDIQIQVHNYDDRLNNYMVIMASAIMFCNFWYLVCYSLMIPATRKRLERQYKSLHNEILQEMSKMDDATKLPVNKLKEYMRKYWLLALTSSPDYVLRKSKLACLCALLNVYFTGFLVVFYLTNSFLSREKRNCTDTAFQQAWCEVIYSPKMEYKWASVVIVWVQRGGIIIGVLISLLRGLESIPFVFNIIKSLFSINKNDYQLLREWMEAPLPIQMRGKVLRKLVSITRMMLVGGLVVLQFATLTICKFSLLILCVIPLVLIRLPGKLFLMLIRKLRGQTIENDDELVKYVLHKKRKNSSSSKMVVQRWKNYHDDWIKKGKTKQPHVLYSFLMNHSSIQHGFKGLRDIYSMDIFWTERISQYDPSKCWGLILVTLGGIVRATSQHVEDERFMNCIDEALKYVLFVDQTLCEKGSRSMCRAAKMVWEGVHLHGRWLDVNLATIASSTDPRSSIFKLNVKSMEYMKEFENVSPTNWTMKVFAIKCMYIITETELQKHYVDYVAASGWSVNWLEDVVVDLIGACLTNLPLAIFTHCSSGKFGLREDKVREAAIILGETHNILAFLEKNGSFRDYPQNKESFGSWCSVSSSVC